MLEERVNGLAMMYVHRDIPCPVEAIVDEFASSSSTKKTRTGQSVRRLLNRTVFTYLSVLIIYLCHL